MKLNTWMDCSCTSIRHMLRVDYWTDDADFLCIHTSLAPLRWYERVWTALRYVLGMDTQFFYQETILHRDDAAQLCSVIGEFLALKEPTEDRARTDKQRIEWWNAYAARVDAERAKGNTDDSHAEA